MNGTKLPTPLVMGLALVLLGVVGSILPGMFVALFWNSSAGWNTMLICGVLLATWFPIKSATDRRYGKTSGIMAALPRSATLATLAIVLLASIVLVPVLWMMTGYVIVLALLAYVFSGVWWVGLLVGLLLQIVLCLRDSSAETASSSIQSSFFVRMDASDNENFFVMNPDPASRRSAQPAPYLLPDDRETVITFDDDEPDLPRDSSAPDTITIDRQPE